MAKYSYRELHFSSKKEMRMYFNEHPNNTVITKKQYKRAVAFEMDKELKREMRKQQICDKIYDECKGAVDRLLDEYNTDSILVAAQKVYEKRWSKHLELRSANQPMRLLNE